MKKFIPFFRPSIGKDEIEEVTHTLNSGWLTTGEKTKKFENNFQNFIGKGNNCIAVSSATAGLHLAVASLNIGPGDEVIVPNHTFTSTAEVVRYTGAEVKLVDVDEKTLNISVDKIKSAINRKTKAIIVVHFAGLSCEMDEIIKFANQKKLFVIEDAAHALPTTYKKQLIGNLKTHATVFSFYANKTITTGEGGMVVTKNKKLAKRIKVLRLHGIDTDAFDRYTANKPKWYYQIVDAGFKYNLADTASAIGIHQLKKVNKLQKRREKIANYYLNEFKGLNLDLPAKAINGDLHSWHLFIIKLRVNDEKIRNMFIENMNNLKIGCSVHYIPLHKHPYWKNRYKLSSDEFPVSEKLFKGIVSLPIYNDLSDSEVEYISNSVRKLTNNI